MAIYAKSQTNGEDKANGAHIVYGLATFVRVRMPKPMVTTDGWQMHLVADFGTQKRWHGQFEVGIVLCAFDVAVTAHSLRTVIVYPVPDLLLLVFVFN